MNRGTPSVLVRTAVALLGVLALTSAQAGIKCWKNKDGVTECGNAVPPEYAQQGHREISERGLTVKETARAKTDEELRAEREEAERLAAERAEQERLAAEQAAHDRVLLSTFTTEDDLELARTGKVAAIQSRITHAENRVKKLQEVLQQLHAEAARLERSGKPVTEKLLGDIGGVQRQIEDNRGFIEDRRTEMEEVQRTFDKDLARYRELKGMGRR